MTMDWGNLTISILALTISIITYFKHDKKLKEQERKINEYQLKQLETESEEKKKAIIKGNIIQNHKGKHILKIYNCGRALATNIRVEGLDIKGIYCRKEHIFPYELMNPQDYTEITLCLTSCCQPKIKLKYIWDDDFKKNNEFEQVLTL